MSEYPESITLVKDTEEYDNLVEHSSLIQNLVEDSNEDLVLSADLMFPNDTASEQERLWGLFVDIFFPEKGIRRFFSEKNGKLYINQSRGTEEDLKGLLDFMMIDKPSTMMNFAKAQAKKTVNRPQPVVTKGRQPKEVGAAALEYMNQQAEKRALNSYNYNFPSANNDYNYPENENNGSNNTRLGYTEEEEEVLSKLKGHAAKKYYPNERRKANRRTRRNKSRRSNMLRKKTRRATRK